jgi:hypothetical protein
MSFIVDISSLRRTTTVMGTTTQQLWCLPSKHDIPRTFVLLVLVE